MAGAADNTNPAQGLAGLGKRDHIKIDPDVARTGVVLCQNAVATALAISTKATEVSKLTPFSNLGTGAELASKFSGKAADLKAIMDLHVKILNDLADAFKAAARSFEGTDAASHREFYKLTMPTKPGDLGPAPAPPDLKTPLPNGWFTPLLGEISRKYPEYTGGPSSATPLAVPVRTGYKKDPNFANFKGETENWIAGSENPAGISIEEYRNLPVSIRPDYIIYVAETWTLMAKALGEGFKTFRDGLNGFEGRWGGDAKTRAIDATRKYAGMTESVAHDVGWIGANLRDAADWLGRTRSEAMTVISRGTPDPKVDPRTSFYYIISETYNPGLAASTTSVPKLQPPDSPVTGIPGTPGQTGTPGTGGRGKSGRPSGLKTGSQLRDAARKAAQQAAQNLLGQQPAQLPPPDEIRTGPARPGDPGLPTGGPLIEPVPPRPKDEPLNKPMTPGMPQGLDQLLQNAQRATPLGEKPTVPASVHSAAADPAGPKLGGPGPGPGGAPGPGLPNSPLADAQSRLFPRAGLPTTPFGAEVANAARTGLSAMPGTPGSPGAAGSPGAGHGQDKEHKRLRQLTSKDNLDEAMGAPQLVSEPVVGE
ncbi:hypothetical protein [Nocardia sp. NPDC049149]|uniref:hypothetical protein n=1 Tax=Nocardia sp. NPDC049149 TaxID=3364315 RepID=UPI0037240F39